ncbi:4-hydroxybenzoate polyprenyltransferase [bacterium A37T11]|nr:4-hydroxybenzoate polyprenyltransferase [bacterium A37T11]
MNKFRGLLLLMRPANIITAIADVLAGAAITGIWAQREHTLPPGIGWLCLSTIGLYGGGVVFNDVFDAELDRVERPERPIPSGVVRLQEAQLLGLILLLTGITAAFIASNLSGVIAILTAIGALVYNKWSKHQSLIGPLNMGLCRGLNLLLGISILPSAVPALGYLSLIPLVYIAAVTTISRGEVHGSSRTPLYLSAFLYLLVVLSVWTFGIYRHQALVTSLFLIGLVWMTGKPLLKAIAQPIGPNIGKAVKAGVIALILLNAAWAAAAGTLYVAIFILILLPISIALSKLFAVT